MNDASPSGMASGMLSMVVKDQWMIAAGGFRPQREVAEITSSSGPAPSSSCRSSVSWCPSLSSAPGTGVARALSAHFSSLSGPAGSLAIPMTFT